MYGGWRGTLEDTVRILQAFFLEARAQCVPTPISTQGRHTQRDRNRHTEETRIVYPHPNRYPV